MAEHKTGTREDWEAARAELAKLEAEQAERNEEIKRKRLELPQIGWRMSSTPRTARRSSPSCSTAASRSPTTSCIGPTTRWVPAPAAPAWPTGSTVS